MPLFTGDRLERQCVSLCKGIRPSRALRSFAFDGIVASEGKNSSYPAFDVSRPSGGGILDLQKKKKKIFF